MYSSPAARSPTRGASMTSSTSTAPSGITPRASHAVFAASLPHTTPSNRAAWPTDSWRGMSLAM